WSSPACATSATEPVFREAARAPGAALRFKSRLAPDERAAFPPSASFPAMKLLVIGSGGREHAIAWRLTSNPRVQKVYVAPGNAGTALEPGLQNIALSGVNQLLAFAQREGIQLTVVGPEASLAEGVVDAFRAAG